MCSVDGYTGNHNFTLKQYAVFNQDRGPDGTSYWEDDNVHIAHSLLSIQENSSGIQQPYEFGDHVLSYNGEIFGIEGFDTQWLADVLQEGAWSQLKYKTNGMWAFSLYNKKTQTITLARDHFGVKPLYYMILDGDLFWSSTAKPLLAVLDNKNIKTRNFQYKERHDKLDGFWLSPYHNYFYINRLPPGSIIHWNINTKQIVRDSFWGDGKNWNLEPNMNWDPDEYREIAERCLAEACYEPRVKKCLSMSGGLDSSLLAYVNRNNENFMASTVTYERIVEDATTSTRRMDEYIRAEQWAQELGIEQHTITIDRNYPEKLEEVATRIGDHIWLASRSVPRLENIRNASQHGAKVYITGDMADELVTGYNGHFWYFVDRNRIHPNGFTRIIDEFIQGDIVHGEPLYSEVTKWYPSHLHGYDYLNNHLFYKALFSTDSFCGLVDHLCGSFGIESRIPFCSQEFAKYVLKIPSSAKLKVPTQKMIRTTHTHLLPNTTHSERFPEIQSAYAGWYKWLIREEFGDVLPSYVTQYHKKIGFSTPWNARNWKLNNKIRMEELRKCLKVVDKTFTF